MNDKYSTTEGKTSEKLSDEAMLSAQWKNIDWHKAEREVNRLQIRIVKATQQKDYNAVKRLQYLLTHSFYAKALAVKRVVTNDGRKTPGVDGVLWNTPAKKMAAVLSLTDKGYRTRPLRRVYIRQQYGTEPEYPWHDWNAVLRHNDNNKWYGVVLEVSADKLGLPEAGIIDVLNVKSDPLLIGSLRGQDGYFPAYHMNKEKWLSIQLGKPELDDAIKDLLSLSYELTAPKKRNRKLPANNPGDSANGKEKETDEG